MVLAYMLLVNYEAPLLYPVVYAGRSMTFLMIDTSTAAQPLQGSEHLRPVSQLQV
jgi:hypothetical protein